MKSFRSLVSEMKSLETLDELESGADLFDFGIEKNIYNISQAKQFNEIYWSMKNKIITKSISSQFPKTDYTQLKSIVIGSPMAIKEDKNQLINYIHDRLREVHSKVA
jgi:hypothetical protein